jgi:nickel/cobalt transporter (NicO) family protein
MPLMTLPRKIFWQQTGLSLLALAAAILIALALLWFLSAPPKPVQNPFGVGAKEFGTPNSGFMAAILHMQSQFYRQMQQAVLALQKGGAFWPLISLGFAYGVFHAAGPGHGKAVIAAYVTADERALVRAIGFSFGAAFFQAFIAIALVTIFAVILGATSAALNHSSRMIEILGFGVMLLMGLALTWRKAGALVSPSLSCHDETCDHAHMPKPDELSAHRSWTAYSAIIMAAGARPCAGALILLVLALSNQIFFAGIAGVLAMALGVALTTSLIATLAVLAKRLALFLAGGRGMKGEMALKTLELTASACLAILGAFLLTGYWQGVERAL